ncbi:helix-turn-helix domain-containing protein [Herbidospora sp. RD11066]
MAGHQRRKTPHAEEHPEYTRALRDLDLGDRLREARLARNLTQAEVAEQAGISQAELDHIELGGGVPTGELLGRISRVVGGAFLTAQEVLAMNEADRAQWFYDNRE